MPRKSKEVTPEIQGIIDSVSAQLRKGLEKSLTGRAEVIPEFLKSLKEITTSIVSQCIPPSRVENVRINPSTGLVEATLLVPRSLAKAAGLLPIKPYAEVLSKDNEDISLVKLLGQPILDIECYLSRQYGEPTLVVSRIVLVDGTSLRMEGEHDYPYLDHTKHITYEEMETLYQQYEDFHDQHEQDE